MATLKIDTHDFIKHLMQSGIPEEHAEAIAGGLSKVDLEGVATREDIQEIRQRLAELKTELLMWIVPLLLGQTITFAALVKWLVG